MAIEIKPISLAVADTVTSYDQTKTSLIGKIQRRTLNGKDVVGPPIVRYRNTVLSSEAITPLETHYTDNNRAFIITVEAFGIITCALYEIDPDDLSETYIGKINIQVPEPPTTTYTVRCFRVDDTGTTGWTIILGLNANVAAHTGLYMVNDVNLSDFQALPVSFPTATAPSQKAVYKFENSPNTLNLPTGGFIDKATKTVYIHNGLAATHQYFAFNYGGTITTVGALGVTTDTFLFVTGNLPALTGTLLATNSEEFCEPTTGPNASQDCFIFHTSTVMYRTRVSDLSSGSTTFPNLEFANNSPGLNLITAESTVRATYSDSVQRVILLTTNNVYIVKEFADNVNDFYTVIEGRDNDEAVAKEMYPFRVGAVGGFDSRNGNSIILSTTSGQRGFYIGSFDIDDEYDLTHIISPVIDVSNKVLLRLTAAFVKPEFASPLCLYYRTSGFGSASGGWVTAGTELDLGAITSPTGQIQLKICYKVFANNSTNPLQIESMGLVCFDLASISDFWEYDQDNSSSGSPTKIVFRLKKAYPTSVPTLTFFATDLSNSVVTNQTTVSDPLRFEYSTDGGVTYSPLGTIPNTVGTRLKYEYVTPPGVDIRPAIREA